MQTQSATFDRLSNQDRDRDHQETHHRGQRQRETGKCKWQTIRKFQERGDPPRVRVQFKTTTRTRRPTASASTVQDNDKNEDTPPAADCSGECNPGQVKTNKEEAPRAYQQEGHERSPTRSPTTRPTRRPTSQPTRRKS